MTAIKILFLMANPRQTAALRVGEEAREIRDRLQKAEASGFDIQVELAVRVSDLQRALMKHQPHILHFSGHGSAAAELIFEDQSGNPAPVAPEALARLFALLKRNLRCVLLNACYSQPQAEALARSIDCVIGMSRPIADSTAVHFAAGFYQALVFGESVAAAVELGRVEVLLHNCEDADVPQLLTRAGVSAAEVRFTDQPEAHPRGPVQAASGDENYVARLSRIPLELPALRRAIKDALVTDAQLGAFLQQFPRLRRAGINEGSDRDRKITLLFDYEPDLSVIRQRLIAYLREQE